MKNYATTLAVLLAVFPLVFCLVISCEEGPCCKMGELLSNATVCRPAENECDATEYCSGSSSLCPIDLSIMEGTPCGGIVDPGTCVDDVCWNSVAKAKVKYCDDTCSKINGNCSPNGVCICYEPWTNPPFCNINSNYDNNVNQSNYDFVRDMEIIRI